MGVPPRVGVLGRRLRGDCNVEGGASRGAMMGTLGGVARYETGKLGSLPHLGGRGASRRLAPRVGGRREVAWGLQRGGRGHHAER
jgi:hypothetical protein